MVRPDTESMKTKKGLLKFTKSLFYRLLQIFFCLRHSAPDPVFWPKPDPYPCIHGELSPYIRVTGLASSDDYILTGDENGDLNLLDLFTLQVSF